LLHEVRLSAPLIEGANGRVALAIVLFYLIARLGSTTRFTRIPAQLAHSSECMWSGESLVDMIPTMTSDLFGTLSMAETFVVSLVIVCAGMLAVVVWTDCQTARRHRSVRHRFLYSGRSRFTA
jgi:hypothetical protein